MDSFFDSWHQSALTTFGLFWMAFWAFALGYVISSMIQVFVTRERMKRSMGEAGPKSVALGTVFGFISSSCSFAALATTRSLFTKGAGIVPSLAFLLASTNLVIELGIVIAVFLSWQFVVGEYLGGLLLILFMWLLVRIFRPDKMIQKAREHARKQQESGDEENSDPPDWKKLIRSKDGWAKVAMRYCMEWKMVWKDVTIGFTIAGIIAVFVPQSFFEALFVGSGTDEPAFWQVLAQTIIGPIAAFFTFIGSMGNIPLAAVLYSNGVAFAGVMAFIFSDLVVFPVLRIQIKYYGWKLALYIMGIFLLCLVLASILMHYGFALAGLLPDGESVKSVTDREFFKINYTFFFNIAGILVTLGFLAWFYLRYGTDMMSGSSRPSEKALFVVAILAGIWLAGGLSVGLIL